MRRPRADVLALWEEIDRLNDHLHATTLEAQTARGQRDAAVAEVARLRQRYDEAVAHLHGIVEADRQDAKMGHPNPGDSCVSTYLGLVVMEWLETRAALGETDDG